MHSHSADTRNVFYFLREPLVTFRRLLGGGDIQNSSVGYRGAELFLHLRCQLLLFLPQPPLDFTPKLASIRTVTLRNDA